jgi:hypothetical protein
MATQIVMDRTRDTRHNFDAKNAEFGRYRDIADIEQAAAIKLDL